MGMGEKIKPWTCLNFSTVKKRTDRATLVFNQYIDIIISDNDMMEFIEKADTDRDGYLNQRIFL